MSSRYTPHRQHEPMYGWALDSRGRPIPIGAAQRGANDYRCPICNEPMIARKGDVKQHHFAHENLKFCTPENVAAAIGGLWLVLELGKQMVLKHSCTIQWHLGGEVTITDMLKDVVEIIENYETELGTAEIALVDSHRKIRAVISLSSPPDEVTLARFASSGILTLILPVDNFRSGQLGLMELLQSSKISGGWALLQNNAEIGLIEEPTQLLETLKSLVHYPPYQFWGKLETVGSRQNILRVHDRLLWLPQEIWQTAIGGTMNPLSAQLNIISQELPQVDGSIIAFYYVMLRNERAIAIRRFRMGQNVQARLSATFRMRSTTIEEIAQLLATG